MKPIIIARFNDGQEFLEELRAIKAAPIVRVTKEWRPDPVYEFPS